MNQLIIFSFVGIIFFIYSFLCCKKRKVIYTINEPEFNVLDDRYFDLQLKVSIVNSIVLFIGGIASQLLNFKAIPMFISLLIFWIINFYLIKIAVDRKYAQIVKEDQL